MEQQAKAAGLIVLMKTWHLDEDGMREWDRIKEQIMRDEMQIKGKGW